MRDDIELEKEAYVRRWYLEHPEGRAQLKQMIEEAEQKPDYETIEQALSNLVFWATRDGNVPSFGIEEAKGRVKAAAQREYGKVLGEQNERIKAWRGRHGEVRLQRLAEARNDDVVAPAGYSYWLHPDDIPGILYALSTLEEK